MDTIYRYTWFLAHFEHTPSPGRTIAHQLTPPSLGGRRVKANTYFLSAREALHAYGWLWKTACGPRVPARARQRYARALWARLHSPDLAHLLGKSAWLRRAVSPYIREQNAIHAAPVEATLWHVDGRKVEGNQPTLAAATGLDSRRVRDLLCGRRPYASGWCTSAEEAAKGWRKTGRKPRKAGLFF